MDIILVTIRLKDTLVPTPPDAVLCCNYQHQHHHRHLHQMITARLVMVNKNHHHHRNDQELAARIPYFFSSHIYASVAVWNVKKYGVLLWPSSSGGSNIIFLQTVLHFYSSGEKRRRDRQKSTTIPSSIRSITSCLRRVRSSQRRYSCEHSFSASEFLCRQFHHSPSSCSLFFVQRSMNISKV